MKIIVIGHSDYFSTYGAATSIRNHFKAFSNEEDMQFYHVYRRGIKLKNSCELVNTPKNLLDLKEMWLPINENVFSHTPTSFFKKIYGVIFPNLISKFNQKKIINYIEVINPDVIHLNSIVLWPIILKIKKNNKLKNTKIIMHVREFIDDSGILEAKKSFDQINRFVFIDEAVKKRIEFYISSSVLSKSSIIQNPFEQVTCNDDTIKEIFSSELSNFCLAGVISEDKGVQFICEVFSATELINSRLLIVGKKNSLLENLKNTYKSENIIFTGEIKNLSERGAFNYLDCVVRGETEFCTGRTTYEALYAGAYVIMPCQESDIENDKELLRFRSNIICYKPRDFVSLKQALIIVSKLIEEKKQHYKNEIYSSNFLTYKNKMSKIYDSSFVEFNQI